MAGLNLYRVDHAPLEWALIESQAVRFSGAPDPSFFMMYEGVDFCKRLIECGFHILACNDQSLMNRLHLDSGGRFTRFYSRRGHYSSIIHFYILRKYCSTKRLFAYMIRQMEFTLASLVAHYSF